jgi:hypothetical protein
MRDGIHYIEYLGDVRLLAARAIEAATGEIVENLADIWTPEHIISWRSISINFFSPQIDDKTHSLLHCPSLYRFRPWHKKYPDAHSLVAGFEDQITILRAESYEEWAKRVCRPFEPKFHRVLEYGG